MRLLRRTTSPLRLPRMMRPGGRQATRSQRMDADSGRHSSKFPVGKSASPSPRTTASVKVCGCRPHEGGATHTGAGVRKPPKEETAGGRERWSVRSYGNLVAGALLPKCIERVFGKRSRGQRTRSTDRDMQNRRCASEIEREDGCP